jgi:ABC-type multidrug transport system fused ATPase/permease subunit
VAVRRGSHSFNLHIQQGANLDSKPKFQPSTTNPQPLTPNPQIAVYYRSTGRELKRLQSVVTSPIYSLFSEACAGAPVIRAFGLVDSFYSQIENRVDALNRVTLSFYSANRWLSIRLELCGNCIATFSSLAAVTAPLYFASFNADYAVLIAFALSQALSITNTLGWSVRMWSDVEGSMNSVERAEEYVKLEPEAATHVPDNDCGSWPSEGKITFNSVVMRYRPGLPSVLNQTSFEIKGGEKCGIVGRTGSG